MDWPGALSLQVNAGKELSYIMLDWDCFTCCRSINVSYPKLTTGFGSSNFPDPFICNLAWVRSCWYLTIWGSYNSNLCTLHDFVMLIALRNNNYQFWIFHIVYIFSVVGTAPTSLSWRTSAWKMRRISSPAGDSLHRQVASNLSAPSFNEPKRILSFIYAIILSTRLDPIDLKTQ